MPTEISWADETWNPVTGCDPVSAGCLHCYAERITKRRPQQYPNGFGVTLWPERLDKPGSWRKPKRIFVCSMADLFHGAIPHDYLCQVWDVMCANPQHIFMVLTKRSERLRELAPLLPWPPHIWAGVSVEKTRWMSRIDDLRQVPAARRFISAEPLLEPLQGLRWKLDGIHLVIVGGESGPGFRPMDVAWVRRIWEACHATGTSFFFKQHGGRTPKAGGRELDGKVYDEMPAPVEVGRLF